MIVVGSTPTLEMIDTMTKNTQDGQGMTLDMFGNYVQHGKYHITQISYEDTKPFILDIHYAKRMPSITYAYGLFDCENKLTGCVTYGSPASPRVCDGIAGKEYKDLVIELNRLVLKNNEKNEASILISSSLRLLPKPKIVISYADTSQNHIGFVYQATNFDYVGLSAKRTDRVFIDGTKQKHGRHVISTDVENIKKRTVLVDRPRKHRYIYFLGNKTEKKQYKRNLKYEIEDYPKNNYKEMIND